MRLKTSQIPFFNLKHQGSHMGLIKYRIVKSVFKTLKKYWSLPRYTQSIEKVWKFQIQPFVIKLCSFTADDSFTDLFLIVFHE